MNETVIKLRQAAKNQRWQYRRLVARQKYGKELSQSVPVLFANAVPKAGSHLLFQIVMGMCELGPFIDSGCSAVTRDEGNRNIPEDAVYKKIMALRPGDIGYGKVGCKPPFIEALTKPGMAAAFIYRDPRDLVISRTRYATEMHKGHWLHKHFNEVLTTDEERYKLIIAGSEDPAFPYTDIVDRYKDYLGWINQPTFNVKFEDMIDDRQNSLNRFLDFVAEKGFTPSVSRQEAVAVLEKAIQPKKSGTFRKGTTGQWREAFSPAIKDLFKETTGDLLIQLGYEEDQNW